MHALIIEDEAVIAMTIEDMLLTLGFETTETAATESDAVAIAGLRRPDLVTADVQLLEGDGVTAVARIRALFTETDPLKVVFVTGNPDLARDAGAPVLEKPFRLEHLEQVIAGLGAIPR